MLEIGVPDTHPGRVYRPLIIPQLLQPAGGSYFLWAPYYNYTIYKDPQSPILIFRSHNYTIRGPQSPILLIRSLSPSALTGSSPKG